MRRAGAVPVRGLAHHASCSSRTTSSSTRRSRCASGCRCWRKIVVFDMEGLRDLDDPTVISLDALRALGRALQRGAPRRAGRSASRPAQPDDLAILVYTSGTTGKPKGAMHIARAASSTPCAATTRSSPQDEATSACASCRCATSPSASAASTSRSTPARSLNFVENPETVPENVREIAPTVFTAVPRVWEKFYSGVMIALKEAEPRCSRPPTPGRSAWARRSPTRVLAGAAGAARRCKLQFTLARWLALDNVRKLIGIHRARFLVTGAAPISPDLVKWYLALGVPMLEVWGMTETCGAATGMPAGRIKPGSIGPAAPLQRGAHRPGHRRDPGARPQRLHGLPEPAGEDRRDDRRRRLAAHRRRRHGRRRRVSSASPTG